MIIDGKAIAQETISALKSQVNKDLHLAMVLVGDDKGLEKFIELKKKAAENINIESSNYKLPENATQEELENLISNLSLDDELNGIILELPLPKHLHPQKAANKIPLQKDVDVLSDEFQKKFYKNESEILPPAVEALKIILEKYKIEPTGKKVAVFGQGLLIGKPVSHWLESKGAKVARIDEFTKNPAQFSKEADIIVSGVGKPDLINPEMIKEGSVLIDFGYSYKDGQIKGDVDPLTSEKASLFTPVPGGTGPIVIAAVLKNLIILNQ